MSNLLRVGFSGLGTHAFRGHIDHCSGLFSVEAVCDLNPERMDMVPGSTHYGDYESMLRHPGLDAVFIMTPDRFHAEQTIQALEAGLHVFCEKPMVENMLLHMARDKGLILSSCHPRRFDRPFLWLQERLPQFIRRMGKPLTFQFDFFYNAPPESKAGLHTGLLIDHLAHEVDTMNWLFGPCALNARKLHDSQLSYTVAGQRDDGITFLFSGTRLLTNGLYPETAHVRFERGTVSLDASSGMVLIVDHETCERREEICGTTDYDGRFRMVNQNFVEAVRGLVPSYLTHDDLWNNTAVAVSLSENEEFTSGLLFK